MGVRNLRSELQSLTFECLFKDSYEKIKQEHDQQLQLNLKKIKSIEKKLNDVVGASGIKSQISWWPERYYSIYKKMKREGFYKAYGLVLFKIIVPTVEDCYKTMGCVHQYFKPIPSQIKDYIASPKINGYQSLQTVVMSEDSSITFNVMIRTPEMNNVCEYGILALESVKDSKGDFNAKLQSFVDKLQRFKSELDFAGYKTVGDEPMKITILAKEYGYRGGEISDYLATQGVFVEFSDPDYLVLMPSPQNSDAELDIAKAALLSLPKKSRISDTPPKVYIPKRACSVREAILSPSEVLPIEECIGKTVASVTAACPPAIPIAVSGEIIDEETINRFCYYGTEKCSVIKK